jgi:hypothetical protein
VNKPRSEVVVHRHLDYFRRLQTILGLQMGLPDLLIKPVQALTRYHMFFEDLSRLSERAGQAREAKLYGECRDLARDVSRAANDMMAAGKIEGFPGDLGRQGELVWRGEARCREAAGQGQAGARGSVLGRGRRPSAKLERATIFLFRQCVLVCRVGERGELGLWHAFPVARLTLRDPAMVGRCSAVQCSAVQGGGECEFELHEGGGGETVGGPRDAGPRQAADTGHCNMTVAVEPLAEKEECVRRIQGEIQALKELANRMMNPARSTSVHGLRRAASRAGGLGQETRNRHASAR